MIQNHLTPYVDGPYDIIQADADGILIKKHLQFLEVFISVKSLHFLPTFCNSAVWKNSLMILYLSKFPDKSIFYYWQLAFTKIKLWITNSGNKQLLFFQNKKNNNWVEVSLSQTNCTSPMSTLTFNWYWNLNTSMYTCYLNCPNMVVLFDATYFSPVWASWACWANLKNSKVIT